MIAEVSLMIRSATFVVLVALACAWMPALAHAQPQQGARPSAQDRIVAQALFDDGRRLMSKRRYHEACAKFEESNRLDPAMGTQYNLADCYDLIGRYTRAWILFIDVAAAARASGEREREAAARRRAAQLQPHLTRLRIVVDDPLPGLVVRLGEREVPAAQWGTALPIEGGDYQLHADAPGFRPWQRTVRVEGEGATVDANVPELEPEKGSALTLPPEPSAPDPRQVRLGAAISMAGLAAIGIGVGAGAGIVAIQKKNQADEHCPAKNQCYQEGLDLRDAARSAATVSTVSFAISGSALVGAALLWLTAGEAPDAPDAAVPADGSATRWQLAPWATPEGAGMGVELSF